MNIDVDATGALLQVKSSGEEVLPKGSSQTSLTEPSAQAKLHCPASARPLRRMSSYHCLACAVAPTLNRAEGIDVSAVVMHVAANDAGGGDEGATIRIDNEIPLNTTVKLDADPRENEKRTRHDALDAHVGCGSVVAWNRFALCPHA
jgi:hypothetical protein